MSSLLISRKLVLPLMRHLPLDEIVNSALIWTSPTSFSSTTPKLSFIIQFQYLYLRSIYVVVCISVSTSLKLVFLYRPLLILFPSFSSFLSIFNYTSSHLLLKLLDRNLCIRFGDLNSSFPIPLQNMPFGNIGKTIFRCQPFTFSTSCPYQHTDYCLRDY